MSIQSLYHDLLKNQPEKRAPQRKKEKRRAQLDLTKELLNHLVGDDSIKNAESPTPEEGTDQERTEQEPTVRGLPEEATDGERGAQEKGGPKKTGRRTKRTTKKDD